jgi:membrane protein YqaA with SNARE-associated domain
MLRRLYDRIMLLAATRWALPWLAVIAFAESSFFPVPPDVMLAPMVLARPERGYLFAGVCTLGSVLGGMLGYAIGYFLAPLGVKLLALMGHAGGLETFQAWYAHWGVWVILVKGLTPIPFKLVTIASGLAAFSFPVFVGAAIVTRAARFFLVAAIFKHFGPPARAFVEKRLTLVTTVVAIVLVGAIVAVRYLG